VGKSKHNERFGICGGRDPKEPQSLNWGRIYLEVAVVEQTMTKTGLRSKGNRHKYVVDRRIAKENPEVRMGSWAEKVRHCERW